jgi:hypothetical protein
LHLVEKRAKELEKRLEASEKARKEAKRKDVSVGDLHDLVMRFKPTVLCVVETQLQKLRVKGLARTLGFDHFL